MKAYKLTDKQNRTKWGTQWGENFSHTATGKYADLCSNGWIHFYRNPLIAVLMNPVHAGFAEPRLWECETSGEHLHERLKSGCKTLTTIKEISLPVITIEQKIAFGILCTKKGCKSSEWNEWNEWADKWLSKEDRTPASAFQVSEFICIRNITYRVPTLGAVKYTNTGTAYETAVAHHAAIRAASYVANAATASYSEFARAVDIGRAACSIGDIPKITIDMAMEAEKAMTFK